MFWEMMTGAVPFKGIDRRENVMATLPPWDQGACVDAAADLFQVCTACRCLRFCVCA